MTSSPTRARRPVAYVLRRFPKVSETFILNEILALEARGVRVQIFSLHPTRDSRFHEDLGRLRASVDYLPPASEWRKLLDHHRRVARREPRRYGRTLLSVLRSGRPSLLWRFVQAGYVAERLHRLKARHVHAHFATRPTTVASLAARLAGLPHSFTAHAVDIYKNTVDPAVLAQKIEDARFVVTVSESNSGYLESLARGRKHEIVRVYNGIDLDRFRSDERPSASPFTILAVARLVEKKGLTDLVEACRILRERGAVFRCWIAGKGNQRAPLEGLIRDGKLDEHVRLLGAMKQLELVERYRTAHVFALPCRVAADGNRDGLPVALVEALAAGLPVVTTPVTGIPEVVQHGLNGLLVPERDPDALADALESLISDATLAEHLASSARSSVLEKFDLRRTGEQLRRLFDEEAGCAS